MIDDLIDVASLLLSGQAQGTTQAALRRCVSTIYYALFQALALANADSLVLAIEDPGWRRVYRAVQHADAKRVMARLLLTGSDHPASVFAQAFTELQDQRHVADYDPSSHFTVAGVAALLTEAKAAIAVYRNLPVEVHRDLATQMLLKTRP